MQISAQEKPTENNVKSVDKSKQDFKTYLNGQRPHLIKKNSRIELSVEVMCAAQLLGQTEAVEWPKLLSGRSTGQQSEATSQESNQNK